MTTPTSTTPAQSETQPAPPRSGMGARVAFSLMLLTASVLAVGLVYFRRANFLDTSGSPAGRARADVIHLEALVRHYMRVAGEPPAQEKGLQALVEVGVIETLPLDPWGHPYAYRREPARGVVYSLGRDGQEGGSGEDADIYNPAVKGP